MGCVFQFRRDFSKSRGEFYLQLGEGETTASTNPAVVLDSRAPHDGTQLVNRTGSDGGGLCETGLTTAVLTARLEFPNKSVSQGAKMLKPGFLSKVLLQLVACDAIRVGKGVSISYLVEVHAHTTLPVLAEI